MVYTLIIAPSDAACEVPVLSKMVQVIRCSTTKEVLEQITLHDFDAAILSGSSLNLSQPTRIQYTRKSILALLRLTDIPVLGICFGMQLIASMYGGVVERLNLSRETEETIKVNEGCVLLRGECKTIKVTLSHQDFVKQLPTDFVEYSKCGECIQIMECLKYLRFGCQFHPERKPKNESICVLKNFFNFVILINTFYMR